jgi:hypothetical protein
MNHANLFATIQGGHARAVNKDPPLRWGMTILVRDYWGVCLHGQLLNTTLETFFGVVGVDGAQGSS